MKATALAAATAIAFGLSAGVALAQDAGFGGDPNTTKNQMPAPSTNPSDPAAGTPASPSQVPTSPQAQEDLYDSGTTGAGAGEGGADLSKPQTSDPAQ